MIKFGVNCSHLSLPNDIYLCQQRYVSQLCGQLPRATRKGVVNDILNLHYLIGACDSFATKIF